MQLTLCLIKPDAVKRNLIGAILAMIEQEGLEIVGLKKIHLTKKNAENFYAVHKERPFFDSLTDSMAAGPIVAAVLRGDNAIERYRKLMGATNPQEALEGTIRKKYAISLEANSVHGSDGAETAAIEIPFFFNAMDLF